LISRISALPNYCNGKLYKRWDRVSNIFGENTLLASKTNKNGETVELLISSNGKRELFTDTCKIMDIIGEDNIRRTYSYQRTEKGIEGKMVTENSKDKPLPLITSANWLVKNLIPQEVNLTLNTAHPKAQMVIPNPTLDIIKINKVTVKHIKASEFIDTLNPIPSKMEITLKDGSVVESKSPTTGNIFDTKSRLVQPETHPIDYINVVV